MKSRVCVILLALAALGSAQYGAFDPAKTPAAKVPVPTFDLVHVKVCLDVDYAKRGFSGWVENTIKSPAAGDAVFHAEAGLAISKALVDGKEVQITRSGADVTIVGLAAGNHVVRIEYNRSKSQGGSFGGGGGWHWIEPNDIDPNNIGFWTQGETLYNRGWVPMWDYPNDFATSEAIITVDKDWTVVGNGGLHSNTAKGDRRTFHWKQEQPHATYLISLVGGPLDYAKDMWQGVELWYVTPKGKGHLIPSSYGDTKDMLTYFSKITGVKYPWVKYAQNAMIDFGGGMENISATTLGAGALTDGRNGMWTMSGLNAHELAHQWFGDLVTCKDWSHIWLNESWATFMQACYFEHERGKHEYERNIYGDMMGYMGEAARYKRPIRTEHYPNPDSMFDSHTYPKGAAVMHTLRRQIGEKAFWDGVKLYLNRHANKPVISDDLCQAFSETSKTDLKPFWEQWIYKPGHPVLEYDWSVDAGKLTIKVKQTQSTQFGAPIYRIPAKVATIRGQWVKRYDILLTSEENTYTIAVPERPEAVMLDPDMDFLREIKHEFAPSELPAIAEFAPCAVDRQAAFSKMLQGSPKHVELAVRLLMYDRNEYPVIPDASALLAHVAENQKDFWLAELRHPNFDRRADAVSAYAKLPNKNPAMFRNLVDSKQPDAVVLRALEQLDPLKDREAFLSATMYLIDNKSSPRLENPARLQAVFSKLAGSGDPIIMKRIVEASKSTDAETVRVAVSALALMPPDATTREILGRMLDKKNSRIVSAAIGVLEKKPDPVLKPKLQSMSMRADLSAQMKEQIKKLVGA